MENLANRSKLKVKSLINFNSLFFLLYSFFFLVFFLKGVVVLDPDFGWHYKFGELVVKNQDVPRTDTFSYTMPSYPYVNHEWLTDVFIYYLYESIGKIGLSFIFAALAVASLFLVVPPKLKKYSIPLLILSGGVLFQFCGVRPQVISWIFLALVIRVIFDENFFQKTRWFLPLVFLLWVNLHGAFASGFFLLTIFLFYKLFITLSKNIEIAKPFTQSIYLSVNKNRSNFLILFLCLLATLINPYHFYIWTEVHKTLSSKYLSSYIAEWQPIITFFNLSTFMLMTLSATLIFIMKNELNKFQIFIYGLFLVLGLRNIRHIPVFTLIALPLTTITFYRIVEKASKNKISLIRAIAVYKILTITCLLLVVLEITFFFSDINISENHSYPKKAFTYIQKNALSGNIFTDYRWGGYQIWKSDRPTFVDGRMAIWENHDISGESQNAFKEYLDIISGDKDDFGILAEKYQIKTVVWHAPEKPSTKNVFSQVKIVSYLQNFFKPQKTKSFGEKVEKAGFRRIYQDDVAVIYSKE